MHFAARSLRAQGSWLICPRPSFAGQCIEVTGEEEELRLPRPFSGAIRSVKLLAPPPEPAKPKPPAPPPPETEKVRPAPPRG